MNTQKLKEAVYELQQQKSSLEKAIAELQKIISSSNGTAEMAQGHSKQTIGSYLDLAIKILDNANHPMHIKEIAFEIGKIKAGKTPSRASLEATLARHMKDEGEESKIVRTSPGHFGLSTWKNEKQSPSNLMLMGIEKG